MNMRLAALLLVIGIGWSWASIEIVKLFFSDRCSLVCKIILAGGSSS